MNEYSLRILKKDKVRLDWLLETDDGNDSDYTDVLKKDINDLCVSIETLTNAQSK